MLAEAAKKSEELRARYVSDIKEPMLREYQGIFNNYKAQLSAAAARDLSWDDYEEAINNAAGPLDEQANRIQEKYQAKQGELNSALDEYINEGFPEDPIVSQEIREGTNIITAYLTPSSWRLTPLQDIFNRKKEFLRAAAAARELTSPGPWYVDFKRQKDVGLVRKWAKA